jgi:thiol-disulfide isomerase/thioredoxin
MRSLLAALLFIPLLACSSGDPAPGSLRLEDYRGQWLVINYWAQWCKPCIAEIPELNQFDSDYDQVTVLGVNYDGASGEELEAQLQELGVTFPTLAEDPASQLGTTRPRVLPTTLVIDPQGLLVETLLGPQTVETLAAATRQSRPDDSAESHNK